MMASFVSTTIGYTTTIMTSYILKEICGILSHKIVVWHHLEKNDDVSRNSGVTKRSIRKKVRHRSVFLKNWKLPADQSGRSVGKGKHFGSKISSVYVSCYRNGWTEQKERSNRCYWSWCCFFKLRFVKQLPKRLKISCQRPLQIDVQWNKQWNASTNQDI